MPLQGAFQAANGTVRNGTWYDPGPAFVGDTVVAFHISDGRFVVPCALRIHVISEPEAVVRLNVSEDDRLPLGPALPLGCAAAVLQPPFYGTLTGAGQRLVYRPAPERAGTDYLQLHLSCPEAAPAASPTTSADPVATPSPSPTARPPHTPGPHVEFLIVVVDVLPVPDPPRARDSVCHADEGVPVRCELAITDVDTPLSALTLHVGPQYDGLVLYARLPSVILRPYPDWNDRRTGPMRVDFVVCDRDACVQATLTIRIEPAPVTPPPSPPARDVTRTPYLINSSWIFDEAYSYRFRLPQQVPVPIPLPP